MAALLVAGLLIAGCGGDDDDNDASDASGTDTSSTDVAGTTTDSGDDAADSHSGEDTPTITRAALIKQGDAICAKIEKSITAQGTKIFNATEKEGNGPGFQVRVVDEVLVPEYQTMVDDIRALGAPRGDEEQLDAIFDAMEQRVVVMGEDPERFFKPNPADRREFNGMLALVKGYGFKQCYQ